MVASAFRTGMRTDTDGQGVAGVDCGMRTERSFMSRDFNGVDPAATGSIQSITKVSVLLTGEYLQERARRAAPRCRCAPSHAAAAARATSRPCRIA